MAATRQDEAERKYDAGAAGVVFPDLTEASGTTRVGQPAVCGPGVGVLPRASGGPWPSPAGVGPTPTWMKGENVALGEGTARPDVVVTWSQQPSSEQSKLRLAAWALTKLGVSFQDLDLGRFCPRCGSDGHGRPYFIGRQDIAVSLSSTEGVTAVAVTRGEPVGLDVEHLDDVRFAEVGSVLLHPDEAAADGYQLARTWVRKESLLKALGVGLGADPRTVRLAPADEDPEVRGPLPVPVVDRAWMSDLVLAPPFIGSVTVLAPRQPVVRLLEEAAEGPSP